MNHLRAAFKAKDGKRIPYQSWEIRLGGYKWLALVLGDPFLPIEHNHRLIEFLLEKYFKVYAPDMPEAGRTASKGGNLDTYTAHLGEFRLFLEEKEKSLPIIPIVFSLSALPFLHYYFHVLPPMKAVALVSPLLDFASAPLKSSLFFKRAIPIKVSKEKLSGDSCELEQIESYLSADFLISKKLIGDLRKDFKDFPGALPVESVDVRLGVFLGESDTMINQERIENLKNRMNRGSLELFSYSRVKHLILFDKYWKNALSDIGSFIDGSVTKLAS